MEPGEEQYLIVVVPVDEVRRLGAVLHQAGQVDGGARVDVHVGAAKDVRARLCKEEAGLGVRVMKREERAKVCWITF